MSWLHDEMEKTAAKKKVRGYLRVREGQTEVVKPYQREGDDVPEGGPPEQPEVSESRAQRDMLLWAKWKAGGYKQEDLRPLLKSLGGAIGSQTRYFKQSGVRIPPSVIDAQAYSLALRGLMTYDPSRGTQVATHVINAMRRLRRVVNQHRNMARIPETRIDEVRNFQRANEELEESLGRVPTDVEMAGYLKWPIKQVQTLGTELRRDLWTHSSKWEEDPTAYVPRQGETILKLIKYELTPDEKAVYQRFVEESVESTTKISELTGFPQPKVSKLKASIAAKIEKYLEGSSGSST